MAAVKQYTVPEIRNVITTGIADWERRNGDISRKWGIPRRDIAQIFFQIAMAESGLTNAKGDTFIENKQSNESNSPWQINKIHTQYDIKKLTEDPFYAFQAALDIADQQTDGRGDPSERFYDWTTYRLLDPDDQGPYQFPGGSRAPDEKEREAARQKFAEASRAWSGLNWDSGDHQAYAPSGATQQQVSGGTTGGGTTTGNTPSTKNFNRIRSQDKKSLDRALLGLIPKLINPAATAGWAWGTLQVNIAKSLGLAGGDPDWGKLDPTKAIQEVAEGLGIDALQDFGGLSDAGYDLIFRMAVADDLVTLGITDRMERYVIDRARDLLINSVNKTIVETPGLDNQAVAGWQAAKDAYDADPSGEAIRKLMGYANQIEDLGGRPALQSRFELPRDERDRIRKELEDKYNPWLVDQRLPYAETQELLDRLDGARTQVDFDDISKAMDQMIIDRVPDAERPEWLQGLTAAEDTLAQQARDEQAAAVAAQAGDTGVTTVTEKVTETEEELPRALSPYQMALRGLGPNVTNVMDNGDGSYTVTFMDDFGQTTTGRYAYEEGDGTTAPSFRPLGQLQMSATGQGFTTRYNPVTGQDELVTVGDRLSGFTQMETYTDAQGQRWAYDPYDPSKPHQRMGVGQTRDAFVEDRTYDRDVLTSDRAFAENQRQFNTQMASQNYFDSLEEVGRNFRTLVGTAPEFANAATNQAQLISEILKDGGDFLARSYFTRGGMSPLPEITQSDLINNLYDEANKIAQFEYDMTAQENQRIARANEDRARQEFAQFNTEQVAKAQTAYDEYLANIPTVTQYQDVPGGFALSDADRAAIDDRIAQIMQSLADVQAGTFGGGGMDQETADIIGANMQSQIDELTAQRDAVGTVTESFEVAGPRRSFDEFKTTFDIPTPSFESWKADYGFQPNPLVTMPQVPVPRQTSQAELIAQARATTPPGVEQVLQGGMPSPLRYPFPLPTFQQLQALTPDERTAMNTRLMTEFNVPLEDVAMQSQRQFGAPSMERNRDLARFRGYAV